MVRKFKPGVTVAGVIHDKGRYLLVEEQTSDGLKLNNPAGHLERGESPVQGCAREVLEETAHVFTAQALLGVYLSRFQRGAADDDVTYMRIAFIGKVGPPVHGQKLDEGIVRTLWMTPDEMRANAHRMRSPLVLQCMEDHLKGKKYPLEVITTHVSVFEALDLA